LPGWGSLQRSPDPVAGSRARKKERKEKERKMRAREEKQRRKEKGGKRSPPQCFLDVVACGSLAGCWSMLT